MTEQQRFDAIKACDRIQELCAQQEQAFRNIIRIFENMAAGRDPNDGVVEIGS